MNEDGAPRLRAMFGRRTVTGRVDVQDDVQRQLPRGLQTAAAYAWRLLVIAAALGVVIWLVMLFKILVIPLMVAILLTALLWPAFSAMLRARWPRWLAIVVSLIGTIVIVAGLLWLAFWQITQQWDQVQQRTVQSWGQLQQYLLDGPLQLSEQQLQSLFNEAMKFLGEQGQMLKTGLIAVGTTFGHVVMGAVLTVFILLCLLADGGHIWTWTLRLFPSASRDTVDAAARNGWATVINYARTQMLVAFIDAVGIGAGAFLLGVPLAAPVAVLVFLGAFIPIVGAVVTGALAVFLALVYNGPWIALWMLVVVLAVQQIEGHVLQPILMGSAVKVHPLAVVLVVAGGALIAGIPGALFAVPLAAFVNVAAETISHGSRRHQGTDPGAHYIWQTVPRARRRRSTS